MTKLTIIATALVLCAVFIPAAFISGLTGQFYKQFAVTIAISTVISAINSLTLSPALAAGMLLACAAAAGGDFATAAKLEEFLGEPAFAPMQTLWKGRGGWGGIAAARPLPPLARAAVEGLRANGLNWTPGAARLRARIALIPDLGPVDVLGVSKEEARERAMDLLSRVGVAEQADKVPAQLSGGQQQRVAIARSLAMQPKAMLFDEPTSALDPEMINEVLEVMVRLAQQGMTMIVITHEMNFARRVADRVVFMADGQIVETGTPDEFFDHPQTKRAQDFLNSIKGH